MAWPSQKSAWRKRFNTRWLRWKIWRAVFRVVPLHRTFSFPMRYVPVCDVAREMLCDTATVETASFTSEQCEQILGPAAINDKIRTARPPSTSATFIRQAAIVPGCAVLGHVEAPMRSADCAMLAIGSRTPPNWNFAKPQRLKVRHFPDGQVTWLRGRHYYHFIEALLPLLAYLDGEHPAGAPLTVLIPAGGPPFQRDVCTAVAAAYPGLTFVPLGADERAETAEYLWLHHASDNDEWLPVTREGMDRLSGILRQHYGLLVPQGGGRMFFSRGNAKQRRLLNEAEVEAVATARGFERFEAHSGNHAEQVRAFANADVIVAVHGAGLTNLLFARSGTTVIEMFPDNCVKSTYLWLAGRLGLKYRAIMGSPGDYHQAFTVDAGRFSAVLDGVLQAGAEHKQEPQGARG